MIAMAILESSEHELTVDEMIEWTKSNFSYYRDSSEKNEKKLVRDKVKANIYLKNIVNE